MNTLVISIIVQSLMSLIPGLPAGVTAFVNKLVAILPQLVTEGEDLVAYVRTQMAAVASMHNEKRDPTQAELDALNAVMTSDLAVLDQASKPVI